MRFTAHLSLLAAVLLAACAPYTYHGSLIDPPVAASDFTLSDQHGGTFRLSDQAGRVVLLFPGYTACPDACPATLAQFKRIRNSLGADAERVRFVLLTVDPERDTAERLAEYLAGFDPGFVGLTGSVETLEPVWKSLGVFREKQPLSSAPAAVAHEHADGDYLMDHTVRIYVVDTDGRLRLTYTADVAADDIARDVRQLLR